MLVFSKGRLAAGTARGAVSVLAKQSLDVRLRIRALLIVVDGKTPR